MLITFEGIDYCGKGEQIKKVREYLEQMRIPYFVNQEPGGSAQGLIDRMLLKNPSLSARALNKAFRNMPDYPQIPLDANGNIEPALPETEILRFVNSRVNNTIKAVIPALKEGKIVLSDRHYHSTMAYQGYGKYRGEKRILDLITILHEMMIFPFGRIDRTFYFDITYEEKEKRRALAEGRDPNDVLENQDQEEFEKIIEGYRTMDREDPRIMQINAMRAPEEIFVDVKKEIERLLRAGGRI